MGSRFRRLILLIWVVHFGALLAALPQSLMLKRRNVLESIDVPLDPPLFGISHWKTGESAKYKVTLAHPGYLEVFHLSFSVLGEETRQSMSLFWLETDIQPLNSIQERIVNKVLRPFGNLTRFTEGAVGELFSQVGENRPLAVPVSMLNVELMSKRRERNWTKSDLGQVEIKVDGGDFRAHQQRFVDSEENSTDVWSTSKVGPVGIIKASSRWWNLELLSHQSKGSVSAIYGSPILIAHP